MRTLVPRKCEYVVDDDKGTLCGKPAVDSLSLGEPWNSTLYLCAIHYEIERQHPSWKETA